MTVERNLIARRQTPDRRLWLVYRSGDECGRFLAEYDWLKGINEVSVRMKSIPGRAEVSFGVEGMMMTWEEKEWTM